jgi:hypothetical protein
MNEAKQSTPAGERNGVKYQIWGDVDINMYRYRIPGIILGGINGGKQAFTPYGPERGFFKNDLPKRCQR